jgi:transcriptional regulator with XRE-family HTH domain
MRESHNMPSDRDKTWGAKVRSLREEREMNRTQLAAAAGITDSYLYRIERGETSPGDRIRINLAAALGVRVESIWDYSDTASDVA